MLFAGVDKRNAQSFKKFLDKEKLISRDYPVFSDDLKVYFPVVKKFSFEEFEVVFFDKDVVRRERKSFDVVGDIAILEIPKELDSKSKIIGELFLEAYPNVKTVVRKLGAHEGDFRIQKFEVIAGEKNFVTSYVENGCRFRLDISKMYFSPRLGSERLRIAKQVKPGEKVLVMFSGYAPYPITILKHSSPCCVYAVELNKDAHEFAVVNRTLNYFDDKLHLINGDVVVEVPKLVKEAGLFDRILMPLPKTGNSFLKTAFSAVRDSGIIHFYYFLREEEVPSKGWQIVDEEAKSFGVSVERISHIVCGQVGKRLYRVCFDFRVLKS